MITIRKAKVKDIPVKVVMIETKDLKLTCMSLGASIINLESKDKDGQFESVVMRFDDLDQYDHSPLYLNQIVGPTAGRYFTGPYNFGDQSVTLDASNNAHLHGGVNGLSFKNFDVDLKDTNKVIFTTTVDEKNSFYPGTQTFKISYTVVGSALQIDFEADTTEDTLVNLTHHGYFNLSGNLKHTVLNHMIKVDADQHVELNEDFIPVKPTKVEGTHLDFRNPSTIKSHMTQDVLNRPEHGVDNPLVLSNEKLIKLYDPISKRCLTVATDYPCVVVYTDNWDQGHSLASVAERKLHSGICFETQLIPNTYNIKGLSGDMLSKNAHYHYKTIFKFDVRDDFDD